MVRRFFGMLAFLIACSPVFAQKTEIYIEPDRDYRLGLELVNKQKYGAARTAFEHTVQSSEAISDEARMNACFYIGYCAAELYHADAEYRLLRFMNLYPESPLKEEAVYVLGNLYYRQKKYKKSIEWFRKIDTNGLTTERRDEVNFKAGYSAYMTEDYESASRSFYAVKDGNSKYATASQYYYAHMAYVNQNYETALKEFLRLRESEAFAPVAPYYITQIYYKQGRYDEVLKFAPGVLDSAGARNGMEISRMVAESFYRKGNYKEAIPYLTDYEKNSPNSGPADYYALAYSYYRTGQYEKAIPYFQKLTIQEDSLAQNAYYHLADCYMRTSAKRSARTAFQSAAKLGFDKEIQEESRFAFSKLSYELSFQSVAIESIRSFIKDFPQSAHIDEANELLISMYANTKNYKDALVAIESVKTKSPSIKAAYQKVAYYRGVELFMDNKPVDAINLFQVSLKNPVDSKLAAEAHYWKGESYYKLGNYADAVKSYNEFLYAPAAVASEKYNLANYNTGYAEFKQENYSAAQTAFRKYVKEKDRTDQARYSDALLRIADCSFMQRDQAAALEYYNQAIVANAKASDYALYQKGIIQGVQGRFAEKAATLERLIEKYPKSMYLDDALYETGQAYLTLGNNASALKNYRRVIAEFPASSYLKKAELGEALVYYNDGKDEQALAACKKIIEKYPNTPEAKEALLQMKNISVAQQKVDEYLAYVKNVPNADVSDAAKDSLVYEAAEVLYTQGKCELAVKDFESYLSRFPNAIFSVNANYYKSDCLFRSKQYDKALPGYEYVNEQPKNAFTEKSLLNAAWIFYRGKQYDQAAQRYAALERTAEVKENLAAAQAGQMRCYARLNDCGAAAEAASEVLVSSPTDKDLENEARLIRGRCYVRSEEYMKAKPELAVVAKRTNSEMTAESKYLLALIEFHLSNYKESQKLIFEIQNQVPSYDYWIAKAFVLLGDNYLAQRDTFQARETYKSIVDNYQKDTNDPDDLKSLAQQKLDELISAENQKNLELHRRKMELQPAAEDSVDVNGLNK